MRMVQCLCVSHPIGCSVDWVDVQCGVTAKCECFDSMETSLFCIRPVHCGGLLLVRDFFSISYGFFFSRTFLTAVRSPQTLCIPLGSDGEPAWLCRVNQPEHFAQRRAICLPGLAGAAPHIAEQGGSDCILLRAAQQCHAYISDKVVKL